MAHPEFSEILHWRTIQHAEHCSAISGTNASTVLAANIGPQIGEPYFLNSFIQLQTNALYSSM
jgi:hypothetical protein